MDNKEMITVVEVCYILGVSENTLRNWYKWYEIKEVECPELPYPVKVGNRNYWNRTDLNKLITFKNWIPKGRNGVMGVVNAKYWSHKSKSSNL